MPEPEGLFTGWDQYPVERPMVERVRFLIQFLPPEQHLTAWVSYWTQNL